MSGKLSTAGLQKSILRGAWAGMQVIRNYAIENVTGRILKRRTGLLANSIEADARKRGNRLLGLIGVLGPAALYGRIWEFEGIKKFFVKPKSAKALRWKVGKNEFAFSRGHWIPGQSPRPFIQPAIQKGRRRLEQNINREAERYLGHGLSRKIRVHK